MSLTYDRDYVLKVAETLSLDEKDLLKEFSVQQATNMTYYIGLAKVGESTKREITAKWKPVLDPIHDLGLLKDRIKSYYDSAGTWGAACDQLENLGVIARNGKHKILPNASTIIASNTKFKYIEDFARILNKFVPNQRTDDVIIDSDDIIVTALKQEIDEAVRIATEADKVHVVKEEKHTQALKEADKTEAEMNEALLYSEECWKKVKELSSKL